MALDLEIVGAVRELSPDEDSPSAAPKFIARLRDSHHQPARLLSRGLPVTEVSRITGYSIARLSWMQNHDPSFGELIAHYRQDQRDDAIEVEARIRMVALDAMQLFHEKMLDSPEEVTPALALEASKVYLDRSGYAPVSKSVNKNLNLNIGARYDRATDKVA